MRGLTPVVDGVASEPRGCGLDGAATLVIDYLNRY